VESVVTAAFGYCFLVFMVRIVGRRPGKQMTPFEFVLIFFIGGLTLTSMVGGDRSFSNALVQIITVASLHYCIALAKQRFPRFAILVDGTPVVLLQDARWQTEAMTGMRIADDDVMAAGRDKGLLTLDQIHYAVLERNGEISVIPLEQESES
jgi:uncharacterized membrane protein YcaP (DUF421 family)